MKQLGFSLFAVLFSLMLSMASGSIAAKEHGNGFQVSLEETKKQAEFVKHLLETSSLAVKMKASSDVKVQNLYQSAKDHYQKALDAIAKGDKQAAAESLFNSKGTMFKAVKLIRPVSNRIIIDTDDDGIDDTDRRVFNLRLESVNALLDAIERIGDEKHVSAKTKQIRNQADAEIANSVAMMNSGHGDDAQKMLNTVYIFVKTNISQLRSGDTLVRSLNFKDKKEEYLYEIDRNDTHQMLVVLLLKEKLRDPVLKKAAQKYLDQAKQLRKEAEALAKKGDHKQAVSKLEESTRNIIKAIRRSGFFIPG